MRRALRYELAVSLRTPALARRLLREWLANQRWPLDEADDLVLAVSEAVTNAVEHAYPSGNRGIVVLEAAEIAGPDGACHVVATVTDDGRWRPPPVDPGNRGRGLAMMRASTHALELDSSSAGTRVTMTSRPVRRDEHIQRGNSRPENTTSGLPGLPPLLLFSVGSEQR
jgi:anti-sigma regulatory factor (Ser/Thr protein kinase)